MHELPALIFFCVEGDVEARFGEYNRAFEMVTRSPDEVGGVAEKVRI